MDLPPGTKMDGTAASTAASPQLQNNGLPVSAGSGSGSVYSCRSSTRSSASSVARKRAEAEAAKTKLKFAEQEAVLKLKQNELAIELELLGHRKDAAAKEAEAQVLESLTPDEHDSDDHQMPPSVNALDRTRQYVEHLPVADVGPVENAVNSDIGASERSFAKYISRKEILKDRLHSFSGRHEHYLSWKDTFRSVTTEIEANACEELDLLLRWAGPGSRQISSIKTANSGNAVLGLKRAWERLDIQYGAPERIESALKTKLNNFPSISTKDSNKLFDLLDILSEISAVKENPQYSQLLSYFDTANGVNPIIGKLPPVIQNKWRDRAQAYKRSQNTLFPPFSFFCTFVQEIAVAFNDPSFDYGTSQTSAVNSARSSRPVTVAKTTSVENNKLFPCFLHSNMHALCECRAFSRKPLEERKLLLKQQGICFRCCEGKHLRKDCKESIQCEDCGATNHVKTMHIRVSNKRETTNKYGGESGGQTPALNVVSNCTELCENRPGKSCAKIVLVNIVDNESNNPPLRAYAIIDDQSNFTLARPELFDYFGVRTRPTQYSLETCGGRITTQGRKAIGLSVQSLDGKEQIRLPVITECEMIPNNRVEIPTPQVAESHAHLAGIAGHIPPLDHGANIVLLLGRDVPVAHHVIEQQLGADNQPFAQRLKLGWVIVGECCLDGTHIPAVVNTMKTFVHDNGRPSIMEMCENAIFCKGLFHRTEGDDRPGFSWEDKGFIQLMSREMKRDDNGTWVAPLPFKQPRPPLPDNKFMAVKRTSCFLRSLQGNTKKKEDTEKFMQALFDNGHAERAPLLQPGEEAWYLPLFGVYHSKKDRIRIVFDSSAKFGGMSLNDVLMTGPNLTSSLLGVLLRFRKGRVAVTADIQQMFYSFLVDPGHRNYLRFVWPENNDLRNELVDYRMNVHVFGNSPSPAVATYGLLQTARLAESDMGSDVRRFVERNFYVDDGLSSHDSSDDAIRLLKQTQKALQEFGNIRLHKICSNSQEVLAAFSKDDLASDLKNLDFDDSFPLQRSLGVFWNIQLDVLTFNVDIDGSSNTRRGVLSTVNSLYDPLGIVAAYTITGKLLLRECVVDKLGWDEPLSDEILDKWKAWKGSLVALQRIQIPRAYCQTPVDDIQHRDLYIFSDASEKAIAAVVYLLTTDKCGNQNISFVLGKAKVAPKHGHTIPRLELCAAVLAIELYETCRDELDMNFRQVKFFTDSKVVLGYINNETKRFFIYVGNRIDRIRMSSRPCQWNYIPSAMNPADDATRGVPAVDMPSSKWLNGPSLSQTEFTTHSETFPLILPEEDSEIRTFKTNKATSSVLGCQRFERLSSWSSVVRAVAVINGVRKSNTADAVLFREKARCAVIKALQHEFFKDEITALTHHRPLPKNSSIRYLSPYIDSDGILRVGGRISEAQLPRNLVNPAIVPKHHLSILIIRHYHENTHHQGRHITEGAIRNAGYWLIGCKRLISSYIHGCVKCRKFRCAPDNPKMADLPFDRLDPTPPFTNIGIDVFGPWQISARKTRGGQANSKRWALMFTCLVIRAVHIELLEEMSSSCFVNALRRFCAIRGEVRIIRSDCGTNFVGATNHMNVNVINVEDRPVKDFLLESKINWIFNPPHSSHMGGAWERMIGLARSILNNMLGNVNNLTHDVLLTLMAEVCSIMNARPLTPVTTDPEFPFPLTPATLLTMKTNHAVKSFDVDTFDRRDLYKQQWRRVQHLADVFWTRWKSEYLPTLQGRTKWTETGRNPKCGDVVLLRDIQKHRNHWPLGVIMNTHEGTDGCVRSVDVRVAEEGKTFTRPVCEIVFLIDADSRKECI